MVEVDVYTCRAFLHAWLYTVDNKVGKFRAEL